MPSQPPVVVIGAAGMLGRALLAELARRGAAHRAVTRRELDLADVQAIEPRLASCAPAAVINAASFTDVNAAEDSGRRHEAYAVNRDAAGGIARACRRLGLPLVHVSTDYVFDGRQTRPYREDDPTGPLQVYGASKLAGEQAVLEAFAGAVVARTSTLYGPGPRARPHYVDAILRQAERHDELRVVELPVSSPTCTTDLAVALVELAGAGASGIVHAVNDGAASRLELARAAVEEAGWADRVEVLTRPDPGAGPARPDYSVLDTARLATLIGRRMSPWRDALRAYVREVWG